MINSELMLLKWKFLTKGIISVAPQSFLQALGTCMSGRLTVVVLMCFKCDGTSSSACTRPLFLPSLHSLLDCIHTSWSRHFLLSQKNSVYASFKVCWRFPLFNTWLGFQYLTGVFMDVGSSQQSSAGTILQIFPPLQLSPNQKHMNQTWHVLMRQMVQYMAAILYADLADVECSVRMQC